MRRRTLLCTAGLMMGLLTVGMGTMYGFHAAIGGLLLVVVTIVFCVALDAEEWTD